jgi:hypothetical protein
LTKREAFVMRYHRFLAWIMILVMSLGLQAGKLQDGEALVYTDPVRLEISAGQVRILHILLVNAEAIYGIDLQATFDPAVVEVMDANSKQAGIQMTSGEFLKPDFVVRNLADNQAGTLRYVVTQLKPTPPANGKGIILSIQFRGKLAGHSTPLTFASAVVADRHGVKQTVKTQGAELVIVRPRSPTPTPTQPVSPNPVPAVPTWSAPSLTPIRSQPTAQPSPTATQDAPATLPGVDTTRNNKAWVPETGTVISDRILTYLRVGGFSGALLLSGLLVWLLWAKRRKARAARTR